MVKRMAKQDNRKDAVYARQSLDKKDSLSIEAQIDGGKACAGGEVEVYADKGYSGKNTDRPGLQRLKADMEVGKIKRVIVYRLDRISRNIADFYQLFKIMEEHNVEFTSISENFETSTPMGRAMMGILVIFAQMERDITIQRIRSGMENARAKGRHIGRRKTTEDDIPSSFFRYYPQYANSGINLSEFARLTGLSRNSIYKYLKIVEEK